MTTTTTTTTSDRSHDLDDVEKDPAQKRTKSANSPSAQLTMSCSEFSANFNISSSSSSSSSTSSDLASAFECLLSFYDLNSSVEYLGRRHQFIGPFHSQVACVVSKGVEDAASFFPYHVVCHVTSGIVRLAFGQEHFFALQRLTEEVLVLAQHVQSFLKSARSDLLLPLPNSFDGEEGDVEVETSPRITAAHPIEPTSSIDDLRSGAFVYVKEPKDGGVLPDPWEIVFRTSGLSSDSSSSMTWRYPQVRTLTAVQVSPIPFMIPDESQAEQLIPSAIPCILQFYDELKREFVNYRTFCLSESKSAILDLPSIHTSDLQDVGISDVWRILIKDNVPEEEDSPSTSPSSSTFPFSSFVPPSALAASARIDSCFSPTFSPRIQLAFRASSLHCLLQNHRRSADYSTPDWLAPFTLDQSEPAVQELGMVVLDRVAVMSAIGRGDGDSISFELYATPELDVVEFACLTYQPVVEPFDVSFKLNLKDTGLFKDISPPSKDIGAEQKRLPRLTAALDVGSVFLRLSQSAVNTLSSAIAVWTPALSPPIAQPQEAAIAAHFIVCNDTNRRLRFGQADTDEEIALEKRKGITYSWRSQQMKKLLRFAISSGSRSNASSSHWSEPIDLFTTGVFSRSIQTSSGIVNLVIGITAVTSVRRKIVVSGQLLFSSRLNQHLEIKVSSEPGDISQEGKDVGGILGAKSTPPSFLVDPSIMKGVRFRIMGPSKAPWTDEVPLASLQNSKGGPHFLNIPYQGSQDQMQISLATFVRDVGGIPQRIIILLPLVCVRTHLPSPLLLEITPLEQPSSSSFVPFRQCEVKGRGSVSQLHHLSSSEPVQLSFQLSSSHRKSEPSLKLTPEMLAGQLPDATPATENADPLDMGYDWEDRSLIDSWPYTCESKRSSKKQKPEESGAQVLPDINLSIIISQCWPGLSTLLIDVAPWALMTNQTSMPLALLDGNGDQWMMGAGQTIAPPSLEDQEFQIGLHHKSQMHYSGHVALLKNESRFGWSEDEENALLLEGFVFIRIHIPSESSKDYHRECRLSLTSTVKNGVRILDIKPQFLIVNRGTAALHLRLHSIPFTHQKVRLNPLKAADCLLRPFRSGRVASGETSIDRKEADLGASAATKKEPDSNHDGDDSGNKGLPLLMWNQQADLCVSASEPARNVLYLDFALDGSSGQSDSTENPPPHPPPRWSIPVRLRYDKSATHRVSFSVPAISSGSSSSAPSSHPYLLTLSETDGAIRLAIDADLHPQILLHNLSPRRLYFGEASVAETSASTASTSARIGGGGGVEVKESRELVNRLPTLDPFDSLHYSFPTLDETFPSLDVDFSASVRLHFAVATDASAKRAGRATTTTLREDEPEYDGGRFAASSSSNPHLRNEADGGEEAKETGDPSSDLDMDALIWSTGVDVFSPEDAFVHVPDCGDFRVQTEREGNLTHVSLTPITRAEVSAKEVRSRIRGSSGDDVSLRRISSLAHSTASLTSPSARASPSFFPRSLASADSFDDGSSYIDFEDGRKSVSSEDQNAGLYSPSNHDGDEDAEALASHWLMTFESCQITANCGHACVIVLDELRRLGSSIEVFRMTFDDITIAGASSSRPESDVKPKFHSPNSLRFFVGVANFQFDNQMASETGFDFPVVLLARDRNEPSPRRSSSASSRVKLEDLAAERRNASLLCADVEMMFRRHDGSSVLDIIEFQLFSQPTVVFCEDVFLRDLLGVVESFVPQLLIPRRSRPSRSPTVLPPPPATLRVRHLALHPLNLLLSLHASLKLYIAADQSPLSFTIFEKRGIHCDAPTLLRALVMHYVTGTLFRAGWVIGSLELLGSPTGLVRSLGQGISDFVQMPYQGLNTGPSDFLRGVSDGSSSLVKHISGGMLTSMTNFASSVSRNMDRLSLDSDHLKRQELLRRQSPVGVTSGLYQGLTGLGLSVLGAVAGVADQPLQGIFAIAGGEDNLSNMQMLSQATTGVVSGVGKGLAGVVTKPIGGAAEFVAQTGSGLLQGTGLLSQPQPRYVPICSELSLGFSGPLKFQWKIFNGASSGDSGKAPASNLRNEATPAESGHSWATSTKADGSEEVVFTLEAIKANSGGLSIPCHLVLTSSALYVISHKEDIQQQAFAISDVNCFSRDNDDSLIFLEPMQRENDPEASANKDRLAEYIQEVALSSRPSFSSSLDFSSLDASVALDAAPSNDQLARNCFQSTSRRLDRVRNSHDASYSTAKRLNSCHQFYIDPNLHDLFLAVVHQTKNNRVNKKFIV